MKKPSFAMIIGGMKPKMGAGSDDDQDPPMGDDDDDSSMRHRVQINATKQFISAIKMGDAEKAYDVLKDLVQMCSGDEEDEDKEPEEDDTQASDSDY